MGDRGIGLLSHLLLPFTPYSAGTPARGDLLAEVLKVVDLGPLSPIRTDRGGIPGVRPYPGGTVGLKESGIVSVKR
jgi:hypothetical protein